ncbi:hypothetical protein F751_1726 [Auxenochlorella protothecoides]|uniref:Uncharacterized protein n=1 Tax=Auxenochlorella protothecoides TaxID=3075 RepID=A0A087SGJ3_AUXPR|nr:hypothetical protein F751_1726 [Auxenochlorella protothecoides]KFM24847.1 hypothetical protein F751_1726 [Auxenochlorella protothecoides]RMZ52591.1 hypothetical protein APUTEX25_000710 [Auxenochlorella protothecoides]|eukprot:RMZ52591.1 hypothetical protein APUTEX25_000710 [Auxenochlorella protothecoides]
MATGGGEDPPLQPDVSHQPSRGPGMRRPTGMGGEDDSHASPSPRHSASATGAHLLNKPTLREQSGDIILEEATALDPPNGRQPPPLPPGLPPSTSPGLAHVPERAHDPTLQAYISRTTNTSDWVAPAGPASRAPQGSVEAQGGASRYALGPGR